MGAFEEENEYTMRWYFILLDLLKFIAKKFESWFECLEIDLKFVEKCILS